MMAARIRAMFLAIGVLGGAAGLTGCTEDHGLPTLGGPTVTTDASLEAIAKKYYNCMTDEGVTVDLKENDRGELAVVQLPRADFMLWRGPDGMAVAISGDRDSKSDPAMEDFYLSTDTDLMLIIDGIDHSQAYARCLMESGYDDNKAWGLVNIDLTVLQLQVTGNNKWAACVRENGWPDVQDSAPPTDPDKWPVIILPPTITEDELRLLLDACPNFDPQEDEMVQQWWDDHPGSGSYPDGVYPDPLISFGIPASANDPNRAPSAYNEAEMERVSRLTRILYEKQDEYYKHKFG